MKSVVSFILTFVWCFSLAQSDDPDLSALINLNDYNSPQTVTGTLAGATSSGAPSCGVSSTDDVFFSFTAVTQGAKFVLSSPSFDGVIDIWDDAGNSVYCINDAIGLGDESCFVPNLIDGDTYHARIHSADGVSGAGNFTLEYSYLPERTLQSAYRTTSLDGDYYRLFDFMRRTVNSAIPVEATRWRLRDLTTDEIQIYQVNGNGYQVSLNTIEDAVATIADPFMCYGDSLGVSVEVVLEGQGCGFGDEHNIYFQEVPNTSLFQAYIGSFLNPGEDFVDAVNTHLDQVIEWEISEFGNVIGSVTTPLGEKRLYLEDVPFLLFNRSYFVRTRVTSCGETGPWSDLFPFFTTDIPYTQVIGSNCNAVFNNGSAISCNNLVIATGYYWQVAPITLNDPNMVPIGPAQVFETDNNFLILSGLAPNTAYRIAVKPIISNGLQVGDYGQFCQIGTPGSGVAFTTDTEDSEDDVDEENDSENDSNSWSWSSYLNFDEAAPMATKSESLLFLSPLDTEQDLLRFKVLSNESETYTLELYDLAGKRVAKMENIMTNSPAEIEISSHLNDQFIIARAFNDNFSLSKLYN